MEIDVKSEKPSILFLKLSELPKEEQPEQATTLQKQQQDHSPKQEDVIAYSEPVICTIDSYDWKAPIPSKTLHEFSNSESYEKTLPVEISGNGFDLLKILT